MEAGSDAQSMSLGKPMSGCELQAAILPSQMTTLLHSSRGASVC